MCRYEMDVFWVVHPGQDPVKLLGKYGKRFELMHVKDMKKGVKTGDLSGKIRRQQRRHAGYRPDELACHSPGRRESWREVLLHRRRVTHCRTTNPAKLEVPEASEVVSVLLGKGGR